MDRAIVVIFLSLFSSAFGYDIPACGADGVLVVKETTLTILTCTGITEDAVSWDFTPEGGLTRQVALCTWSNITCLTADDDYTVFRRQYHTSVLAISRNHRTRIAGTLRCGEKAANGVVADNYASCRVRVVYPARQVTNCHTEVNRTDWTVSGSCDVDKIYASDGRYSCQWYHLPMPVGYQTTFPGTMTLSSFTENGLEFRRGTCSFRGQPVPATGGVQSYSLTVHPGNNFHGGSVFSGQSIEIKNLDDPFLTDCPTVVIEGDDVSCRCHSSGNPLAIVTWLSDGAIEGVLRLREVSRTLDGHTYTCTQYWGGFNVNRRTATYTLNVAYPPSSPPLITGLNADEFHPGDHATVSCTVTGGKPHVSSVAFHCGDRADGVDTVSTVNGQTVVTSSVIFDLLTLRDNGTRCLCYATWTERPDLYTTTATATLTVTSEVDDSREGNGDDDSSSNSSNNNSNARLAAVVGGTVGGVSAAIIIALIIVIAVIVKRSSRSSQQFANNSSELMAIDSNGPVARFASYDNPAMQQAEPRYIPPANEGQLCY